MDLVDKSFVDDLQKHLIEWDLKDDNILGKKVHFVEDNDLLSFKISNFTWELSKPSSKSSHKSA